MAKKKPKAEPVTFLQVLGALGLGIVVLLILLSICDSLLRYWYKH